LSARDRAAERAGARTAEREHAFDSRRARTRSRHKRNEQPHTVSILTEIGGVEGATLPDRTGHDHRACRSVRGAEARGRVGLDGVSWRAIAACPGPPRSTREDRAECDERRAL